MFKNRLLAVIALLGLMSPASAQYAPPNTNLSYGTAPTGFVGGADPYAITPVQSSGWWMGNGLVLPTRESMRDRFWWRAEYLYWGTEGTDIPALVTTSPAGTPQASAGVLGQPGTQILYGGNEINGNSVGGFRSRSGFWFRDGAYALESEFFRLADQNDGFSTGSDGTQILARPYFDAANGVEAAQLISFPNQSSGNISIGSASKLRSFLINARASLVPMQSVECLPCDQPDRVDVIIGYRYIKLEDDLNFSENLTSLVPTAPGTSAISESFRTRNEFNGLQLGGIYQANFQRVWLESMLRVAIGDTKQEVSINGGTAITQGGTTTNYTGGLLAQRTNIGNYQRKEFTMIPEFGTTLGIRLSSCLHATIGYSIIYLPNVVRAGEQIETDVNSNLIPPETVPFTGPPRPRFRFVERDYWAQGLNLGAELRF